MITLNGKMFQCEDGLTVRDLLDLKRYTYPKIIVKVNDAHVDMEDYEVVHVSKGDIVEVIHLMAGG